MTRERWALVVLAGLVLAGVATSVVLALQRNAKAAELKERDRQAERLVAAAGRANARAQAFHDSLERVRAREDSLQRALAARATEQEQAAGAAEQVAVEIRDRWDLNMVELLGVVRPPVRPLARTAKAQGDSTFAAQQLAISQLRGMATSLEGLIASTERELAACFDDVAFCHAARDSLATALDTMTRQRDEWRDHAEQTVLEDLFGSFGETAGRVAVTGAACWWSREACAGAVGVQVFEVAF